MKKTGMTFIVKNIAKLVTGFIAVFGIYVTLTGHLSPGGGFAGGVVLASAAVLMVLALGTVGTRKLVTERQCHVWDAAGALGFLAIALCGYFAGTFFLNFLPVGTPFELLSGGMIPLANLAIMVKVGAGLAGVFLALAAFHMNGTDK
jgi:multicomponent Na+:H+ antiporter subunit B